jgi:ubiquinone/menaquinone biosynthesis C-methylase UbiE
MDANPKRLVAAGYDQIADAYIERFGVSAVRQKWLGRLVESLRSQGNKVLDLGCGAGIPVARGLVALGHSVIGVDGSAQQIMRARRNAPGATFVEADMCEVEFEAASFDAVCAFYSITHIPSAEQGVIISKIAHWLKPGGTLVASFAAGEAGEWISEWLGTTMFFGHRSEDATLRCLDRAGFKVRRALVERQDNEDAVFLWIEAVKTNSLARIASAFGAQHENLGGLRLSERLDGGHAPRL